MSKVIQGFIHSTKTSHIHLDLLGTDRVTHTRQTQTVDLVVDSNSIAWVILDNKSHAVNLLNVEFIHDMIQVYFC